MVFEAAPEHAHAAGEQCRGERVTREAGHTPAVEAKADRPRGVGQKTLGDAAGTPHRPSESPGPPTARISWLRVWRRTLRSLRQPPTCSHHSRRQPPRSPRAAPTVVK